MPRPRLRDAVQAHELYPLGQIPEEYVRRLGAYIVYLLAIGREDMTGDDFGDAWAWAIGGVHLRSPLGIADVVYDNRQAWSMKTVKKTNPLRASTVALISGRCSPDYSYGITDPHEDVQATGTAVLGIWNERVNIARDHYNPVRTVVLVRSEDLTTFALFEEDAVRYPTNEYTWQENRRGNLKGFREGVQAFTWQPHGSQFTIHARVPAEAIRFRVRRPEAIPQATILESVGFDDSWVQLL